MNASSVAVYVDSNGNPPAEPESLVIRSAAVADVARFFEAVGVSMCAVKDGKGADLALGQTVGLSLKVEPATEKPEVRGVSLYFLVDDLEAVVAAAVAAGGAMVRPPEVGLRGRRAILTDPEGRRVILKQLGDPVATADEFEGLDFVINTAGASSKAVKPRTFDADARRALGKQRDGAMLVALGMVLISSAVLLFSSIDAEEQQRLFVQPFYSSNSYLVYLWVVGLALSFAGKAVCILDRRRLANAGAVDTALVLELSGIGALVVLMRNDKSPLLAIICFATSICAFAMSTGAFAHHLGQMQRVLRSQQVGQSAYRATMACLLAVGLFIPVYSLTMWIPKSPGAVSVLLGFAWIGLAIGALVCVVLYLIVLGQFIYAAGRMLRTPAAS